MNPKEKENNQEEELKTQATPNECDEETVGQETSQENEAPLKKGESAEALTVEGQKPDAVIPYEENGKKWYFWYFTDLQSDKEGNELEYTLKQ